MVVFFRRRPKHSILGANGLTREQQYDGNSETRSIEVDEDCTGVILAAFDRETSRLLDTLQTRLDHLEHQHKELINKLEAYEELLNKILKALTPSQQPREISDQSIQKKTPKLVTSAHQIRPIDHNPNSSAAANKKEVVTFFRYQKPSHDVLAKFGNVLIELKAHQDSNKQKNPLTKPLK
jgi:hypothetical protein